MGPGLKIDSALVKDLLKWFAYICVLQTEVALKQMKSRVEQSVLNSYIDKRRKRRKTEGHLSKTVGSQAQRRICGCV
jgi:hypothetical protein